MPAKPQLISEFNFGGGLNRTSDPLHVKDTETTDCQNVDFDIRGAVKKRLGSVLRVTETNVGAGDFVMPYNTPGGSTRLICARPGFTNRYIDSSYVFVSPAGTPGAQTVGATHDGVVAGGKAYVINNVDATWAYDGTTATRLGITANATGNQPKAKYVVYYKGRLYFGNCNGGGNRSRIIYTGSDANPGDVEYFKATSLIDVQPDDGDEITALVPFLDQIIILKRNSLWSLRGDTPSSFRLVLGNPSLGCLAPRTAVSWEKGVIFLSSRGVFSYDGARAIRMSEKIDPDLQALPASALQSAAAAVFGNRYVLAVSTGGGNNDTVFVFDFVTGTWTRYKNWSIKSLATWPRDVNDELWGVDDTTDSAYVQYFSGGHDQGAPINAYWTSKWFDFGVPERRKMGRRLYAFFTAEGNYQVGLDVQKGYQETKFSHFDINLDKGASLWGAGTWGVGVWGTGLDTIRQRLTGLGTQTAFRVKVFDNSINSWTFEGMSFVVTPRNLA